MDKFLETHKLLKLTQEEMENVHRPMTSKENKLVIKKNVQTISGQEGFTGKHYKNTF